MFMAPWLSDGLLVFDVNKIFVIVQPRPSSLEDPYRLAPALPDPPYIDELRDMATDVREGTKRLEATLVSETAQAIGDKCFTC